MADLSPRAQLVATCRTLLLWLPEATVLDLIEQCRAVEGQDSLPPAVFADVLTLVVRGQDPLPYLAELRKYARREIEVAEFAAELDEYQGPPTEHT